MRKSIIALALVATVATNAQADDRWVLPTIVGGIIGYNIGHNNPSPAYRGQTYEVVNGNGAGTRYMSVPVPNSMYYGPTTYYNQPMPAPAPQMAYSEPCDEVYYEGEYNPMLAQNYCRGVRIREYKIRKAQAQEAYNRGLAGQ